MIFLFHWRFIVLLYGKLVAGELFFTSIINSDKGPIVGEILETVDNSIKYSAFRGIPYAEPPVSFFRFQPSIEKNPWNDIYYATNEGNPCIQFNKTSKKIVGSEDCLYLNVFTPITDFNSKIKSANHLLPVMVFIAGGSFTSGHSSIQNFGPDFLIEENVIVVTFNYRLGPLGFLTLNIENSTGNMGLKDQNLVLKWVQNNIVLFGGNPENVTLFGHSAGAASVDLHILSDLSRGLFKQSIAMSGSTLCAYWGIQSHIEAEFNAKLLGKELGIKTENKSKFLQELRDVAAEKIILATLQLPFMSFRPVIENNQLTTKSFISECSVKKFIEGSYNKGPHLMGFTKDETIMFGADLSFLVSITLGVLDWINRVYPIKLSVVESIKAEKKNLSINTLIKETTNLFFILGIDSKQKILSQKNNYPIYYYRFSFDSEYSNHKSSGNNLNGVAHGDDLSYIFYQPSSGVPLRKNDNYVTRRRMVKMWANFAKFGNPTPKNTTNELITEVWPDSVGSGKFLEIGKTLEVIDCRPIDDQVEYWETQGYGLSWVLNDCPGNRTRIDL